MAEGGYIQRKFAKVVEARTLLKRSPENRKPVRRVSHALKDLTDNDTLTLIGEAEKFVGRQGWSYEEFNRDELLYKTVLYLYHTKGLLLKHRQFPCYVVHCVDDDSRFESPSREIAFRHYKRLCKDYRVAMFHWPDKHSQVKVYASDSYPFTRDYGPRED